MTNSRDSRLRLSITGTQSRLAPSNSANRSVSDRSFGGNTAVQYVSECISRSAPCGRCFIATTVSPCDRPSRQYCCTSARASPDSDSTYPTSSNATMVLASGRHSRCSSPVIFCSWYSRRRVPISFVCGQNTTFGCCRTSSQLSTMGHPSRWIVLSAGLVQMTTAPVCRWVMRSRSWVHISHVLPEPVRSEEHTSELQSRRDLVCRLLLEKKK